MREEAGPVVDPETAEEWLARRQGGGEAPLYPYPERSKPYVYGKSDPKVVAKVDEAYAAYLKGAVQ